MRKLALLVLVGSVLAAVGAAAQEAARSVWSGVYTEAQATSGQAAYGEHCGACHAPDLAGTGEAKPLAGPEFVSAWGGLSAGELFERTRTTMPQQDPNSLSRETYADILAYVFKVNGFPAGQAELPGRAEILNGIRIDALKPAALSATYAAADAADGGPNGYPNPYAVQPDFFKLPSGRTMGSSSAVAIDSKGHVWVADRCGANSCTGSALDPILEFDTTGNFIKAFGKGLFNFPHGLFIDARDHLWITDNQVRDGKGAQVHEFTPDGKLVRSLGKAGVSASGPDTFLEPNAVVVAKDGSIFVADGHSPGKGEHRIVKLDAAGRFVTAFGARGAGPGQVEVPHALALDSKGRLFVGDRWNNRISIFEPSGKFVTTWAQFGRPSGVYIDRNDRLYVADSESRTPDGYGHHPGWKRGTRIGSAKTGQVTAFIPDDFGQPDGQATSGPEGVWADGKGAVYLAEVLQKTVVRYVARP